MTGSIQSVEPGYQTRGGRDVPILRVLVVADDTKAEALIEVPATEGRTYYVGRRVSVEWTPR
jgi:hypothetical protein